jgi:5-methyltetrahydrofolate--homocysteine methyltransferase
VRGLAERLEAGEVVLADGAIGTLLMARGLDPGACPEAFGLERPEVLEEIARAYAEAGADVVQANTFGASPLKLEAYGLEASAREIVLRAVEAARRGAAGRALVCGSCGPCGRLLEPWGDATRDAVRSSFGTAMSAFAEAGVDAVFVETMTDPEEAAIAVNAAREAMPRVPVVATMTFDLTPRGFFTIMGTSVEAACRALEEAGAHAVGSNCGQGSGAMVEIAREFRRHARVPIAFQPNAGIPEARMGAVTWPETPKPMAERVRELVDLGVAIVGGCCGTTPEHVLAFREAIDARPR